MKKLTLDSLFSAYAVLQREMPVHIFGSGEENCDICVTLGDVYAKTRVSHGNWEVTLPPMAAQNDLILRVQNMQYPAQTAETAHICLGDVFVAGGQSNMEFNLRFEADYAAEKHHPVNTLVRMFNCRRTVFAGQQLEDPSAGRWFCEDDSACDAFSSVGYYFAKFLQPALGIAVGIIGCNYGGTSASAWVGRQYLETAPLNVYLKDYEAACTALTPLQYDEKAQLYWQYKATEQGRRDDDRMWGSMTLQEQKDYCDYLKTVPVLPMGDRHFSRPCGLYETMLKRITAYPVKAVLWYQGETDASHPELYDQLFCRLIRCWRNDWKVRLPFFAVQLAPFDTWLNESGSTYPVLRAKQLQTADAEPDVFLACIMDLGEKHDIHPKRKREVARRLFLLAQRHLYENDAVLADSPRLLRAVCEEGKAVLEFANAGTGLMDTGDCRKDFCLFHSGIRTEAVHVQTDGMRLMITAKNALECGDKICFAQVPYTHITLCNSARLAAFPFTAVLGAEDEAQKTQGYRHY